MIDHIVRPNGALMESYEPFHLLKRMPHFASETMGQNAQSTSTSGAMGATLVITHRVRDGAVLLGLRSSHPYSEAVSRWRMPPRPASSD
jgi:hypothetical protein